MKTGLIFHIKRLTHIKPVQPDLIRIDIFVPEVPLFRARHLCNLTVNKINCFSVFFFSCQVKKLKQCFSRIHIINI